MNFIVHYDVAAIILSLTIIIFYYTRETIQTKTFRMFRLLMWANLAACLLDFGTALMMNHGGIFPNGVRYVLTILCCIAVYGRAPIYVAYVTYATKGRNPKWELPDYINVFGLFVVELVMIMATPGTQWLFSFNEGGAAFQGAGFDIMYLITAVYYVIALIRVNKYRMNLEKAQIVTVISYTAMNILALIVEMVTDTYLVVQFIASVAILLICFSMENPKDYMDGKLGIFNRDGFLLTLMGKMNQREGFRVIGISVKGIKYLNDTIGVDNNEILLKELSEFLSHIGGVKNVFSLYNSRFAIIYENSNSAEECLVEAIRNRFKKPFVVNNIPVSLEASMAVVRYPEDAQTLDNMVDLLEYAMNRATKNESSEIVRANEELLKKKRREEQVLRAMKVALRDGKFEVHYQPIYSVERECYTAAEALIRLIDTEIGFVSPDEFIPIAEKNGMILEIGEFVFRTVCEFMVREQVWKKGIEHIHVNLSVVQCMQERLAQNFLEIMQANKLPCNRIHLEVTETAAVASSERLSMNMNKLVGEGVQFALDDYGTGFSNATSLIEYPYHTIKIDKSVVWAAMENENAMKVLSHSVAMIKSLQMDIVAEGVETIEQANELGRMGCDYFQGYYYSKPVNETDFLALLNENCA